MLYKPSNPSPYNSVVDYNTDNLAFTASCISTSDIGDMRLAIKDDSCEYYLPLYDTPIGKDIRLVDLCVSSSGIKVAKTIYKSDEYALDDLLDFTNGYKIATSNYTRTPLSSDATISGISDIIKPLKQYRWQVRLYEKNENPEINIGYGFVQSVIKYKPSDSTNLRRILKVRPHTNMFFKHLNDKGNHDTAYDSGIGKQLTEYYDDKVKYKIEFNGTSYDVVDYYYCKTGAYYNSSGTSQNLTVEKQYDEPLFAYIEVDLDASNTDENGKVIEAISEGDEYTILTNYIDSNEYYFSCRQLGTLKFTDPRITGEDKEVKFVSIEELDKNPDDHIYSPTHSNVQIKGSFDSKSGATINYYKATLYQVLSNGEDIQIHDSGYVYSSEVDYSCKDLLDGNTYKLVITVNDSYGNSITQGVYITPKHGGIVKPTILSVEPYHAHNSIIIDFGKLLSIPGHESYQHDKSVVFNDLYGKYHTDTQTYTLSSDESVFNSAQSLDVGLYSGDTSSKDIDFAVRTCSIAPDNTVVYEDIDGTDEDIKCQNPLISMTFRCNDSDTQTIFDFLSDNRKRLNSTIMFRGYKLTWQNYRFCLTPYWRSEKPTMYIGTQKIYYTVYNTPKYYSPYGVVDETWATYVHDAMLRDAASDYSVPYLAFENIRMGIEGESEDEEGGGLYMHTESVAHDFWWQVIITPQQWYIKCLNPPQKNDSTEYYNWEGGGNL